MLSTGSLRDGARSYQTTNLDNLLHQKTLNQPTNIDNIVIEIRLKQ